MAGRQPGHWLGRLVRLLLRGRCENLLCLDGWVHVVTDIPAFLLSFSIAEEKTDVAIVSGEAGALINQHSIFLNGVEVTHDPVDCDIRGNPSETAPDTRSSCSA